MSFQTNIQSFVVLDNNRYMARSGNREWSISREEAVSLYKDGIWMRDARTKQNVLDRAAKPLGTQHVPTLEEQIEADFRTILGNDPLAVVQHASETKKGKKQTAFRLLAIKYKDNGEVYQQVANRVMDYEFVTSGGNGALYHDYRGYVKAHQPKNPGYFTIVTGPHSVLVEGLPEEAYREAERISANHAPATIRAQKPVDSVYGPGAITYIVEW